MPNASAQTEGVALDDFEYQRGEAVVVLFEGRDDAIDGPLVVVLQAAAQGVGQQLLRQAAAEQVALALEDGLQLARPLERLAVRQRPGSVHGEVAVLCAELADGAVVLE